MVKTPLYLQGAITDAHLKGDLEGLIAAMNGGTAAPRPTFSSSHEERDIVENIRRITDSITSGYPNHLNLQGRVKDLTARTNLTNIINRHNQIVAERKKK